MANFQKTNLQEVNLKQKTMAPWVGVTDPGVSIGYADRVRVLLVITRLTIGGDTNVVLDIASSLNDLPNFEVHLAVGPVPENEIDLTPLAYERGIPTILIPSLVNRIDPIMNLKAVMELRKVIVNGKYTIVHTHSSVAGVFGRMAAFAARVPVIVHHVHGWGLQPEMSLPARTSYLMLERLCATFTDRLIAVSKATIQKGLSYHICKEHKFSLIYNGIYLEKFKQKINRQEVLTELGLDPECKIVGMIGRLDKQKNPLDFIRSAALVAKSFPQVQFVIVGEGRLRTECEQLIHKLGLDGQFFLLGFRNDVERILPAFNLMVLSSLWEGLPVVFQEAMSAGKPIVANNVDGASDVIIDGKTGYLVTPHNVEEMAARILSLLQNDDLCFEMGVAAQYNSRMFTTEQMVDSIGYLYRELIAQKTMQIDWLKVIVKRGMDIAASLFGLILFLPFFLLIGFLIKRDSPGPIFYRGKRAGKDGREFDILKFRTMYERPSSYEGTKVTGHNDNRITHIGRWLRDTKINELPQLWNVLVGDMSLVGPRPEDPDIVASWTEDARREILSVHPGITSPASVIYRHEEKMLNTNDVMSTYMKSILPSKIRLDQLYVRNHSFWLDLDVILWTLLVLFPGLGEYQPPENYLFWGPLYRLFRRYVNWFFIDTVITILAFGVVGLFWGILEHLYSISGAEIAVTLAFALVFNLTGALLGINRIAWSKAVFTDVFDTIPALIFATSAAILSNNIVGYLPTDMILMCSSLAFAGFIITRYRTSLIKGFVSKLLRIRASSLSAREKVLIIGSGQAGQFAARMLSFKEGAGAYHVIGFIDDDYYKIGERIQGSRVLGGRKDIPDLVERYDVGVIMFAIHNIDSKDRDEILEYCHRTQATVFLLPDYLGALQNITEISENQGRTAEGKSDPINLSNRNRGPVFAEGVLNRNTFMEVGEKVFSNSQKTGSHLTAMVVEVNQSEQFFESPDSAQADQILVNVAAHCRRVLRNIDIIGQYTNGQFAILLSDQRDIPAKLISTRLSSYVEETFESGSSKMRVKLIIGIANRDEETSTLITLLDRAAANLVVARKAQEKQAVEMQNNTFPKSNLHGDFVRP